MVGVTVTLPPVPAADTTMLTLTVCALPPTVSEMVPLQVVPALIPVWFTETWMLAGVDKTPDGAILSQFDPVQLCVDVLAEKLVAVDACTVSVCGFVAVPMTAGKFMDDVLKVSTPVPLAPLATTRTTG